MVFFFINYEIHHSVFLCKKCNQVAVHVSFKLTGKCSGCDFMPSAHTELLHIQFIYWRSAVTTYLFVDQDPPMERKEAHF